MGCYWSCECTYPMSSREEADCVVKYANDHQFVKNNNYVDIFVGMFNIIYIEFAEDASYGFGSDFIDFAAEIAEKFLLNGTVFIRSDDDDGETPPQKVTFESGKAVHWRGEIVYTRLED